MSYLTQYYVMMYNPVLWDYIAAFYITTFYIADMGPITDPVNGYCYLCTTQEEHRQHLVGQLNIHYLYMYIIVL